ncbi:hypothetical protein ACWGST_03075 [Agromyces sp. NPDC055520]
MSTNDPVDPWRHPIAECDVVMKGGITSGVIYPRALAEFAKTYRLRSLGGASAGAIGAAFGAAAELGRSSGGFAALDAIPATLADGGLLDLFQPTPKTKPLFRALVAASTKRVGPVIGALLRGFWLPASIGGALGIVFIAIGVALWSAAGWLLVVAGALLALIGVIVGVLVGAVRSLAVDVPANSLGLCTGLSEHQDGSAFTEWLARHLDELAGRPATGSPLTFGDLWGGGADLPVASRQIDLRMIGTCLSRSRPYELPFETHNLFYSDAEWGRLFPRRVLDHLHAASDRAAASADLNTRREDEWAAGHEPRLRRLPDGGELPVIVATRLSLSFPLLISAVPLWAVDRSAGAARTAMESDEPEAHPPFQRLWFTDGGLCSNFPLHLFDAPLPTRPTFAINLGPFHPKATVHTEFDEQWRNVWFAKTNKGGLMPDYHDIPGRGLPALMGFAKAAVLTARTWTDSSHLDVLGYRDRILRINHTGAEGGLNLAMDGPAIDLLAERGRAGAERMVDQYTQLHYPEKGPKTATGWDNHRWVRYRSLVAALPEFLEAYNRGHEALRLEASEAPSFRLTGASLALADELIRQLDATAAVAAAAEPKPLQALTDEPKRRGRIRRVPQM